MLNYTATQERVCVWGGPRGSDGGYTEGGSSVPVTQHAVCLPRSSPPALIPDTARRQQEPAIRREREEESVQEIGVCEGNDNREIACSSLIRGLIVI